MVQMVLLLFVTSLLGVLRQLTLCFNGKLTAAIFATLFYTLSAASLVSITHAESPFIWAGVQGITWGAATLIGRTLHDKFKKG